MSNVLTFKPRPTPSAPDAPELLTNADLREQIEIGMQAALDVADHFIAVLNRMDGCPPVQDNAPAAEPVETGAAIVQLRGGVPAASTPAEGAEGIVNAAEPFAPPTSGSSVIHVEPLRWGGRGNTIAAPDAVLLAKVR